MSKDGAPGPSFYGKSRLIAVKREKTAGKSTRLFGDPVFSE